MNEVKPTSSVVHKISSRDHEGIILDLLDDIVLAERKGRLLVDRLDAISKRPTLRLVDINGYFWGIAGAAAFSALLGAIIGFIAHGLLIK